MYICDLRVNQLKFYLKIRVVNGLVQNFKNFFFFDIFVDYFKIVEVLFNDDKNNYRKNIFIVVMLLVLVFFDEKNFRRGWWGVFI